MWIAISEIVARVNEYGNLAAILNKCSWNEIKGESFEQLYCNKACCFINALHILAIQSFNNKSKKFKMT